MHLVTKLSLIARHSKIHPYIYEMIACVFTHTIFQLLKIHLN